uniref:ATP synthase F0 subunit 8 n=1 Tax=Bugula neritina TaxID=10212 RepID=A9UK97_BUGNE|nr:ATP synthase F0 subunit 8 [Bugula neritina]AAT79556.1 ATP synthase F0 subunit 8 [Bugula neritina]
MPHLSPLNWTLIYFIIWSLILSNMISLETFNPILMKLPNKD